MLPNSMRYRLQELSDLAAANNLATRVEGEDLVVMVAPECEMIFANLGDDDSLVGFVGTPWHAHDAVILGLEDGYYAEFDELELLNALLRGEVLVVSEFVDEALVDRWLVHREHVERLTQPPQRVLVVHRLGGG